MTNRTTDYLLLSKADAVTVRKRLERDHEHFYHFTSSIQIDRIKERGLDPICESQASGYPDRRCEPAKAMRYWVRAHLERGEEFARSRNQDQESSAEVEVPCPGDTVLLRTSATSLLTRSFGLDHSYGDVRVKVEEIRGECRQWLTPDEFVSLVTEFGVISSYEVIPAAELEIRDPHGNFQPLGTYRPRGAADAQRWPRR